jgi:hypothetical protein
VVFALLRGAEMLNIRINLTINLRKVGAAVTAGFIILAHLVAPAYAVTAKALPVKEKSITVSLTYLTVTTTKTQATNALASQYAKYFDPETIAFLTEYAKGEPITEWRCLRSLWSHESHFNPKALNMHSGAYGIAQFLPSTWGNYKVVKTPSASLQIKYGLRYIEKRYGSACGAWTFWQKHNWY